jgi:hypothetical protein
MTEDRVIRALLGVMLVAVVITIAFKLT